VNHTGTEIVGVMQTIASLLKIIQVQLYFRNSRTENVVCFFFFQFIGAVMDESNGGKEEEIVMHKVGIRLSKGHVVEELSNVDEKPADGQPKVDGRPRGCCGRS
jgi:hypothetical protein